MEMRERRTGTDREIQMNGSDGELMRQAARQKVYVCVLVKSLLYYAPLQSLNDENIKTALGLLPRPQKQEEEKEMSEKRGMCGDSTVTCSNNGEAVQSDTRTENLQSLAATTLYINYNIYIKHILIHYIIPSSSFILFSPQQKGILSVL